MVTRRRFFALLFTALFSLAWTVALLLPFSKRAEGCGEEYLCRWEDGTQTRENFASAYAAFTDCDGARIILNRGGVAGEILASSRFAVYYETLLRGTIREIQSLDASVPDTLERIALWRSFEARAWRGKDAFYVWTETGVRQKNSVRCRELIAEGSISATLLKNTRASILEVRGGSDFSAKALIGTKVTELRGIAPYFTERGALYLNTLGGTRLVTCPIDMSDFTAAEYDFADEGALAACENLQSLTIPFAGTSRFINIESYRPEIAALFASGKEYKIPSALKRVTVTGGTISATCFYRLEGLEEIVLCGIAATDISREAFLNCTALRSLHAPLANASLSGSFARRTLECGCTLYTREMSA